MHLSCPNCGAEYEVPDGMVAAGGRHVQCTACHTRWFVRGEARPAVSEDQILHRLETWSPRRRPVAVPDIAPSPVLEAEADAEDMDLTRDDAPAPTPPVAPPRRDPPTKPAERPTVSRPAAVAAAAAPRPALRLDLGEAARSRAEPAARPRSRFLGGFLIALAAFLLAFGAYRFGDAIAVRVPAAAPALDGYEGFVDGLRDDLDAQIDAFRERGGASQGPEAGQGSEQVQ